jgi:hypothetical protein
MMHSDESYARLAAEYVKHIREHSPASADCITQIETQFGSRASYLAAFALVMLKDHLNQSGYESLENALKSFTYYIEMETEAEAIRLYRDAANHLLNASESS